MPSIIHIKVNEGRDLDSAIGSNNIGPIPFNSSSSLGPSQTIDSFVEVRLGLETFRTEIVKKTSNPKFNESFRITVVDDSILQNQPVIVNVFERVC